MSGRAGEEHGLGLGASWRVWVRRGGDGEKVQAWGPVFHTPLRAAQGKTALAWQQSDLARLTSLVSESHVQCVWHTVGV